MNLDPEHLAALFAGPGEAVEHDVVHLRTRDGRWVGSCVATAELWAIVVPSGHEPAQALALAFGALAADEVWHLLAARFCSLAWAMDVAIPEGVEDVPIDGWALPERLPPGLADAYAAWQRKADHDHASGPVPLVPVWDGHALVAVVLDEADGPPAVRWLAQVIVEETGSEVPAVCDAEVPAVRDGEVMT